MPVTPKVSDRAYFNQDHKLSNFESTKHSAQIKNLTEPNLNTLNFHTNHLMETKITKLRP